MTRTLTLSLAAALAAGAAPALAGTATLDARSSTNAIVLTAGYGPASVSFSDGSPALGLGDPTGVRVEGLDTAGARYAAYEVSFNAQWDQVQDYRFGNLGGNAVLQASGSLVVSMGSSWFNHVGGLGGSPATQYYEASNWQSFTFTLDSDAAYSFEGMAVEGQRLQMFRWNGVDWVAAASVISPGEGLSFGSSGQILAGQYLLRNAPVDIFRIGAATSGNAWAYTLTLHDTVAVVPEPATGGAMLVGLLGLGLHRRFRPAPAAPAR